MLPGATPDDGGRRTRLDELTERAEKSSDEVGHTLSDTQYCVEGYRAKLGGVRTAAGHDRYGPEMQPLGATQQIRPTQAGEVRGEPPMQPPRNSAFARPERASGEQRRTAFAEPDLEETNSVAVGSDAPVQDIVDTMQTSQGEADNLELPHNTE